MAQTTKKTAKTKTAKYTFKTPAALQKGFRAYVGMFGAVYERAVPVFEKAAKNYDDYAARGEKLETSATSFVKDTSKTVSKFAAKRYAMRTAQMRSFLPSLPAKPANDRVAELEAEIAKLNKKIVTLAKKPSKKTTARVTKVTKKTEKTDQAA